MPLETSGGTHRSRWGGGGLRSRGLCSKNGPNTSSLLQNLLFPLRNHLSDRHGGGGGVQPESVHRTEVQWTCFAISVFTSTAAKGAYDMSLKSFFLRLLLCTPALF